MHSFLPDGGCRAMARINTVAVIECQQFFPDASDQGGMVTSPEIRPPHAATKENVAGDEVLSGRYCRGPPTPESDREHGEP